MKNSRYLALLVVVLLLALIGTSVQAQAPIRVALVMPSSITDISWSQSIYEGLVRVQQELGGASALEIAYTEGMFDVTAASQALRDYAEQGFDIVVAHGAQYGTSLFELAGDYPETSFAWGTATDTGADRGFNNIFAYEAAAQEGGYVNGVMAGLLTESNVIGIVGPVPAGDAILYINGFQQGVYAANPDAQVLLAYTGSFGDTAAAAEVAQTQISAGADVLTGTAQQVVGAIDAIQAAGGLWFGTQADQSPNWPDTVVASQVYDWAPMFRDMIAQRQNGVLGGIVYRLTLENGGQFFAYGNFELPAEVRAAADQAIADIEAGVVYPLAFMPSEIFRVAVVMPSAITDLAWSQAIYTGLTNIQRQLGGTDALEIAYTEGMFDVTAAAGAMRDYAEQGYDLVIAHGTQYGTSLFELAPDYPETSFAWGTATDTGADLGLTNVFAYEAAAQEGGYVNGVMAGLLTQSGTIGVVGPVPAGDALLYINGFQQGVAASNASANVVIAYTGSFGDTALAAETAQTQISAGADVLTGSAQQVVGAIDAIQAAGGYWFGTQSDQSVNWPETVVASQVFNWAPTIGQMIDNILSGTLGGEAYTITLANGGLRIIYGGVDVPADVVAAADAAIAGIIDGSITVARELPGQ
ncbi:MAG: BMP family protein [Chloroflexi bacterium]|nr:BMP family protein [Chloroflexota bacterium]